MKCKLVLLGGAFLAFGFPAFGCVLSIEDSALPSSGRIAAMSLDANHASIGVGAKSAEWRFSVDNDPSWRTRLTATAVVGAAFIDAGSLGGLVSLEPEPGRTCQFLDQHGLLRLRLQLYDNDAVRTVVLLSPVVRLRD